MKALSSVATILLVAPGLAARNDRKEPVAKDCKSFCDQYSHGSCTSYGGSFKCLPGIDVCEDLFWTDHRKIEIYIDWTKSYLGIPVKCERPRYTSEAPKSSTTTTTYAPKPSTTPTTYAPKPRTTTTTYAPKPSTTTTTYAPKPRTTTTTYTPKPRTTTTTYAPKPRTTTTTYAPKPSTTTTTYTPKPSTTTTTYAPKPRTTTTTYAPKPSTTTTAEPPVTYPPTTEPDPVLPQCMFEGKRFECRDYKIVPICRDLYWTDSTYRQICRDLGDGKCGYGDASTPVRCTRKIPGEPYKPRNSCDTFCNKYGDNRCANNYYHIECRGDNHVCRGLYTDAYKSSICLDPVDAFCGLRNRSPFTIAVPCQSIWIVVSVLIAPHFLVEEILLQMRRAFSSLDPKWSCSSDKVINLRHDRGLRQYGLKLLSASVRHDADDRHLIQGSE
ncbi:hypothetical protein FOL47_002110 [Perkinsus chesapeaki]|uniref:Uncharacterized protein n=1 Tax=Perkinsus chesapeaki TaxID=330153 RepID=A0A7J6MGK9_PERCH|nr:hypothetical protein FOL47_002110 [Perkinsus chesapeaki]